MQGPAGGELEVRGAPSAATSPAPGASPFEHHSRHRACSAQLRSATWSLRALVLRHRTAALVCTVLAALAWVAAYAATAPAPHYVLVIDGGSTGTRIHAFQWTPRPRQLPLVEPVPVSAASHKVPSRRAGDRRAFERVETEPGLDAYVRDTHGLAERALRPLLEWAQEAVPRRAWAATPVLLLGTAGLRRLPPAQQEAVLGAAGHALAASPFLFRPAWARVVSGEREGIYGWVALNYLSGRLAPLAEAGEAGDGARGDGARTLGALDLGGSSLEVTFAPAHPRPGDVTVNVSVLGATYGLFTRTHEGYGLNDAFDRSVGLLLDGGRGGAGQGSVGAALQAAGEVLPQPRADGGKQALALKVGIRRLAAAAPARVGHPCLQRGYSHPYTRAGPVAAAEPAAVQLVGEPDWAACERLATAVVNASGACARPPCALGRPQPRAGQPLVGLTGFHVLHHFFGLDPGAGLAALQAKGRRFCDTEWAAIAARRGAEVSVDRYCFRVPYALALLREGLGLREAQLRIGSGREAWVLGAALAEGGAARAGQPPPAPGLAGGLLAVTAAAWLLWLLFLGLALHSADWGASAPPERKPSHPGGGAPGKLYHTGGALVLPSLPLGAGGKAAGGPAAAGEAVPGTPTAVVGGNFSSNVARLASHVGQRKRVPSIDNLHALH